MNHREAREKQTKKKHLSSVIWGRNEKSYPAGSNGHRVIRSVTYIEAKLKGLSDRLHICRGCEKGKNQERFLGLELEEMRTGDAVC